MRNFSALTVAAIAAEIVFVEVDGKPVAAIDNHALVVSGAKSSDKGRLFWVTQANDRTRELAAKRLRAGRAAPLAALTKAGNPRKAWNLTDAVVKVEDVEAAHEAAISNRDEARENAKARRAEEAAARKAEAEANASAKTTTRRGRGKGKAGTVTVEPAPRAELPQVARDALTAAIAQWEAELAEESAAGNFDNVLPLTAKISEAQTRLAA